MYKVSKTLYVDRVFGTFGKFDRFTYNASSGHLNSTFQHMFDDDRKQIVREPEIRFFHEPRTEVIEMSESSPGYSGIIDKYVSLKNDILS